MKKIIRILLIFTAIVMTNTGYSQLVKIFPTATVYTVTGGGSYCAGGNGVPVGLNGSQIGIQYYHQYLGVNSGIIVNGTGGAITFGNQALPGLHTVTSYDPINGCWLPMNGSATVVITPLPSDSIVVTSGSPNVCAPATVSLQALTNAALPTYQWQLNGTNIPGATAPTYTATQSGLYTAIVSTSNGCSNLANQMVNIYALPVATATASPTNVCPGASSTLIATGGVSYLWSTGATTNAIVVTPASNSVYVVTVTNSNGCTATASTSVIVNPIPVASILPFATSICPSGSVTLTANGGASYLWSTGATTASIVATPASTTGYSVIVTNGFGCTASANATVTVNPSPIVSINSSASTICNGENVTLTANGGINYLWNTGAGTTSIIVNPTVTTAYSVTASNVFGCTAATNVVINVNPLPISFIVSSTSNPFCEGGSGATVSLSGSEIGVAYQLKLSGTGNIGTPKNGTGAALSFSGITTAGIYSIEATTLAGCTAIMNGSATITMNPLPAAASAITGLNTVCQNSTGTYFTGGILDATNYIWSVPNGATIVSGQGTTMIQVNFNGNTSGSISVFGQNACGGGQPSSLTVTVNQAPNLFVTAISTDICNGASTNLTANGTGTSFVWSNGGNTQVISVSPPANTTYTVTVTGSNGCLNTGSIAITVHALPSVSLTLTEDNFCTDVNSAVLSGGSPIGGAYSGSCVFSNTVYPPVSGPGTYTVTYTVTDMYGCSNHANDLLTINPIPVVNFSSIVGDVYLDTPPFDLMGNASPTGGTFSGPGMVGSIFNPALAGVAKHMITYTYVHPITGCSASQIQYITVGTMGVEEIQAAVNTISMYPNPATSQLNLHGVNIKEIKSIRIMDVLGKVVYTTEALTENMQLDVSSYPAGMYIISFMDADGLSVSKRFMTDK